MDNVDRRTTLAGNRTIYAAERTYAAWVRTGLVALASGIGAKATLGDVMPEVLIIGTGTIMILFSAFCFGMAVFREVSPGPPSPEPDVRRVPPLALLVINGFLVIVALATLMGIWFGKTGD